MTSLLQSLKESRDYDSSEPFNSIVIPASQSSVFRWFVGLIPTSHFLEDSQRKPSHHMFSFAAPPSEIESFSRARDRFQATFDLLRVSDRRVVLAGVGEGRSCLDETPQYNMKKTLTSEGDMRWKVGRLY
jgi:hypothetical protein